MPMTRRDFLCALAVAPAVAAVPALAAPVDAADVTWSTSTWSMDAAALNSSVQVCVLFNSRTGFVAYGSTFDEAMRLYNQALALTAEPAP